MFVHICGVGAEYSRGWNYPGKINSKGEILVCFFFGGGGG